MDKNLIIENAKKKFNGDLLQIVIRKIEDYFELSKSNYIAKNNYQINDKVLLNKNHLLHGIGNHIDIINVFAERGIISQDYFEDAVKLSFIKREDIPSDITNVLGNNHSDIVNSLVMDIINNSLNKPYIKFSDNIFNSLKKLKSNLNFNLKRNKWL